MTPLVWTKPLSMRIIQRGFGKVSKYVPSALCNRSIQNNTVCHRMVVTATSTKLINAMAVVGDQTNSNFHQKQENNVRLCAAATTALLSGLALVSNNNQNYKKTKCCGIVGVVGTGKYDARLVITICFKNIIFNV
jgi:hypothetical protein